METMKAIVIYEAGGPEKLLLEERPIPELQEGWTLVKVRGFGINRSEIFTREGLSPSVTFPRILGIECVGQVAETTRPDLEIGQKVVSIMGEMGRAFDGSYAEYVLLPNDQIYTVETNLTWTELAAVPETYYTALGSMKIYASSLMIRFWFGLPLAVSVWPLLVWSRHSFQTHISWARSIAVPNSFCSSTKPTTISS